MQFHIPNARVIIRLYKGMKNEAARFEHPYYVQNLFCTKAFLVIKSHILKYILDTFKINIFPMEIFTLFINAI